MLKQAVAVFILLGIIFIAVGVGILWNVQVLIVVSALVCFLVALLMFVFAISIFTWDRKVQSFKQRMGKMFPFLSYFK